MRKKPMPPLLCHGVAGFKLTMSDNNRHHSKAPAKGSQRYLGIAIVLLTVLIVPAQAAERLVLRGGWVVDGTGREPQRADVSIQDGRIDAVGSVVPESSDRVISAQGLIVSPGFIDLHNHSRQGIFEEGEAKTQVSQGITTLLLGADGSSPYPIGAFLKRLEETPVAVNVALMVGHGTLRSRVLGTDFKRHANGDEVKAMAAMVAQAMREGAFGLSTGLEYDPGFYSSTEEIIHLAREAAQFNGFYMSHIRDEEEGILGAIEEAIRVGQEAGCPVQISHLKLGNKRVWGQTTQVLELLETAASGGLDILADAYPYNAWASSLSILVPSRRFEDRAAIAEAFDRVGGADKILITRYEADPSLEFKTLKEIAGLEREEPTDTFIHIMQSGGADIVCESMSEADVQAFYRHRLVLVASDGGIDSRHPRGAGTFARVLGRYVREKNLLSLTTAVRKMTELPATRLNLLKRGAIKPGYWADLVLFDPETVLDRATFQNPRTPSQGILLTLVNGVVVWEGGATSGQRPGQVLRRGLNDPRLQAEGFHGVE